MSATLRQPRRNPVPAFIAEDAITRLSKAMQALALAESVMDYCQGDRWERECTEKERAEFAAIVEELRKP